MKVAEKMDKIRGKGFVILNAKDQIKDAIVGTICSMLSSSPTYTEGTILIGMAYNEDKTIELSTKEARQGYPDQNEDGTYSYKIISSNNQILHSANFINPSLIETSLSGEEISITPPKSFVEDGTSIPETESITQYPITFELLIPYFNNAERVDIYDDLSSLVTSIPVSDIQIES
ncbi:hypothetical protein CL632_03865 [bacterium]|nr:hypothetical protein [bacterium]